MCVAPTIASTGSLAMFAAIRRASSRVSRLAAARRPGSIVDRLPNEAKLVYVTPFHQCPLGYTVSLPRRLDELLEYGKAIEGVAKGLAMIC